MEDFNLARRVEDLKDFDLGHRTLGFDLINERMKFESLKQLST